MSSPEPTDRITEIRHHHDVIRVRAWEAMPHQHGTVGCRCLSCYDDPTGWVMDHPSALACDEQPAAPGVDSGRDRESCDYGPLLSYEEADALAHAADDIGFLLDQADANRLALSVALGLGTGAPWDAIEERAAELSAAALAAPADRAAVLREAADIAAQWKSDCQQCAVELEVARELRRLADEAQQVLGTVTAQPETEDESCGRFVPDAPRAPGLCASCGDARGWHSLQAVDAPQPAPADRGTAAAIDETAATIQAEGAQR